MALGHSSLPNRHQYVRLTSPHFLPVHPVYQSILCTSLYDRLVRMRHVSTTGWRGQRTAQPVPGVNPALALAKFASAFEAIHRSPARAPKMATTWLAIGGVAGIRGALVG